MNRKTTTFTLIRTSHEEVHFTEQIILLLMACIKHAAVTGTKNDEVPELGPKGTDLIRLVRDTYSLQHWDAVRNIRSMVNNFELRHFAPIVTEEEKVTAKKVLWHLNEHGQLSSMFRDDIIAMIDHIE